MSDPYTNGETMSERRPIYVYDGVIRGMRERRATYRDIAIAIGVIYGDEYAWESIRRRCADLGMPRDHRRGGYHRTVASGARTRTEGA